MNKEKNFGMRLEQGLFTAIQREAKKRQISAASLIRLVVSNWIKNPTF